MANKEQSTNELLPYLYETVYKASFIVKGGYSYNMLENALSNIPEKQKIASIKFCIKTHIYLEEISSIFETINILEKLGIEYSNKKYDRYYEKIKYYREDLSKIIENYQKLCKNPESLNIILDTINNQNHTILPYPKPSTMINDLLSRP